MEKPESKDSSFFGPFILGAVIGAVLGVLFAPDKGSKTREKIADKLKNMKGPFNSEFEDDSNNTENERPI